jgi:hypothetical protein
MLTLINKHLVRKLVNQVFIKNIVSINHLFKKLLLVTKYKIENKALIDCYIVRIIYDIIH